MAQTTYIEVLLDVNEVTYDIKVRSDLMVRDLLHEIYTEFKDLKGGPTEGHCLMPQRGVRALDERWPITRLGANPQITCLSRAALPVLPYLNVDQKEIKQRAPRQLSPAERGYLCWRINPLP